MPDAYYFTHSCSIFGNSVINSLNRMVGDTFFSKEAFQDSLVLWQGVPLVFAQQHPDPFLFQRDRKSALKAVNGRIVGKGFNPRIEKDKLVLSLRICDSDVLALQREGKLSLSSAFIGIRDTNRRLLRIESVNHILLFKKDDKNQPRDKTVQINMEENKMQKEYLNKFKPNADGYANENALIVANPRMLYVLHPETNKELKLEPLPSDGYSWNAITKKWE